MTSTATPQIDHREHPEQCADSTEIVHREHHGNCANCEHPAPENFCPACGQKTHIETPTLFEFIHEYLHHYVALEGTLTRTLWTLITGPGRLTTEYIAGRRQRYIKPLQLYLTISFIFFVLLGLFGSIVHVIPNTGGDEQTQAQVIIKNLHPGPRAASGADEDSAQDKAEAALELALDKKEQARDAAKDKAKPGGQMLSSDVPWINNFGARLERLKDEYMAHPDDTMAHLQKEGMRKLPYVVFMLMPIFAFLLRITYFRRRFVYGVHLVFVLHVHAFAYLLFLLSLLPFAPAGPLATVFVVYFVAALRKVYGGRWIPQILRALALFIVYGLFVAFGLLGLVISLI
ncbi:DUF3667 domain-containing protein [Undibacterium terreum]|uniref:DUF3667 domain-containing protein n=1 Tax=Undibacterium terreum TaxID=1224302 RepID=A0A916XS23_9BURK|nr:DUF3667 domain-containing protein [Undibacterium terreum]GGD01681.1 hypothetical protein GCM10011396_56500 [Undibacterium terreum]